MIRLHVLPYTVSKSCSYMDRPYCEKCCSLAISDFLWSLKQWMDCEGFGKIHVLMYEISL